MDTKQQIVGRVTSCVVWCAYICVQQVQRGIQAIATSSPGKGTQKVMQGPIETLALGISLRVMRRCACLPNPIQPAQFSDHGTSFCPDQSEGVLETHTS